MTEYITTVEKRFRISTDRAQSLRQFSQAKTLSEDQIVEKALDILFSLTELLDAPSEQRGWSFLSEKSLQRIWDNDEDAVYDHWQEYPVK